MDRPPARLPSAPAPNEQTQWFIVRLKDFGFGGPVTIDALKTAIEAGTLSWTDIAYVGEGTSGKWKRLFELEDLRKVLPPLPDDLRMKKYTERAGSAPKTAPNAARTNGGWAEHLAAVASRVPRADWSNARYWYLLLDGKEVGPVDLSQIDQAAKTSKIPASVFGWNLRMNRWKPFAEIPELSKYVGKASARGSTGDLSLVIERATQKRRSARKSLVAAIFQIKSNAPAEMLGICGDVSADGVQLLQYGHTVDYITGTPLNLEIRVSKLSTITSFRASAVVKWFDPVKKIVGLEFVGLDPMDRKLLEKFTNQPVY